MKKILKELIQENEKHGITADETCKYVNYLLTHDRNSNPEKILEDLLEASRAR